MKAIRITFEEFRALVADTENSAHLFLWNDGDE